MTAGECQKDPNVVAESTLEELLEKTAQVIADAGDMPHRMKAEAKRLDQHLASYNYVVETRRADLRRGARLFLERWGGEKADTEEAGE